MLTLNPDRRFELQQYFIRAHNETLSVVAVCIDNPDCSSLAMNG